MRGDYTETRTYCDERLALWRELGDRSGEIHSLISLGRLAIDEGDDLRAAALHEEALALARASGYAYGVARALFGFGEVAQRRGAYDQAAARYTEALALMRELELSGHTALVLISGYSAVRPLAAHAYLLLPLFEAVRAILEIGTPAHNSDVWGSAYLESFFDQSFDRLRRSMQQLTQP